MLHFLFVWLICLIPISGGLTAQEDMPFKPAGENREMKYNFALSEGLKFKMLGNPAEAARYFTECTEVLPDRPVPWYELALLAVNDKDFARAEAWVMTARKLDPENTWYRLLEVQILTAQDRFREAADLYLDLRDIDPEEKAYTLAALSMLIQSGEQKEALKLIREIKQDEDLLAEALLKEKDIYLSQGKTNLALKRMRELADAFPDQIEYRGMLAEWLAEQGRDEDALREYQSIKDSNPGNPIVYFSLGQFYSDKGMKTEAIREFKTGFQSKQVSPDIKYSLFLELLRENQSDSLNGEMVELLKAMYVADAGHPGIDGLYADYLYNTGNVQESEPIYKRVVQSNPSAFMAWQRLLFIQNDQLDFEDMFQFGKRASQLFPNQSVFFLFYGLAANALEKYEEAVEALKKGKRLNAPNSDVTKQYYISLGDALFHTGAYEEAFRNYDLLLVLDSENAVVLNNYAYYLSLIDQDLDKALHMIEKCLQLEPDHPTYLDTYAWVLFKRGDYAQALVQIEKALLLETGEASGEVLEHYGDILFKNGNTNKAVEIWEQAERTQGASEDIRKKIENRRLHDEP